MLYCSIVTIKSDFFPYLLVKETLSETHSSQQAPLFPLLVNSQSVLAGSGTLLTESLPKLSLSSVELTAHLAEHLHTHIKTLHRLKQGEWTTLGDLIAVWKRSSRKSVNIWLERMMATQNNVIFMQMKPMHQVLDIVWMHVCGRDRDYEFSWASPVCLTRLSWWNQDEISYASRST